MIDLRATPLPEDVTLAAGPYRAAIRFAAITLVMLALVCAAWFPWSAVARHRLQREIDAMRRRGEPTQPDELPRAPTGDGPDVATLWQAALTAVSATVDCPSNSNLQIDHNYPTYSAAWWAAARASESANAPVFPLADAAATAAAGPMSSVPFNACRGLANVLTDSALLAHFDGGHDGRALDRLRDALRLADAVDRRPDMLSRLVASGIRSLALERLMIITPDLDVGPRGGERRRQVRAMIDALLSEPSTALRVLPLSAERVNQIGAFAQLHLANPLLAPLVDLSAARAIGASGVDIRAALSSDAEAAAAVYADAEAAAAVYAAAVVPPPLDAAGRPREDSSQPSRYFDQGARMVAAPYTQIDWVVRAHRHAAAVALAVRLYRVDHDGRWPATLPELVPDEIAAVPPDPAAAGSPPIGYVVRGRGRPDGAGRPVLFIGPRRATPPGPPPTPSFTVEHPDRLIWLDLDRWDVPLSPPPTTTDAVPGGM